VCVCVSVQVRRHFRPELLNRLDEIVIFDPLSHEQLRKVARLQMKDVAVRLAERGIALAVTDAALDVILSLSYDPVYGARPIRRWIEKQVVTQLSKMLIQEEIDENSTVYIDAAARKDELDYKVDRSGGLVNAVTGQKSDILIQVPSNAVRGDAAQAVKKMRSWRRTTTAWTRSRLCVPIGSQAGRGAPACCCYVWRISV
jgi:ATP-dependent Clp protease ATP-binding subunit ClpB